MGNDFEQLRLSGVTKQERVLGYVPRIDKGTPDTTRLTPAEIEEMARFEKSVWGVGQVATTDIEARAAHAEKIIQAGYDSAPLFDVPLEFEGYSI